MVTVGANVADTAGVGVRLTLGVHVTLDAGMMVNIGEDVGVAVLIAVAASVQADSSIASAIRIILDLLSMMYFLLSAEAKFETSLRGICYARITNAVEIGNTALQFGNAFSVDLISSSPSNLDAERGIWKYRRGQRRRKAERPPHSSGLQALHQSMPEAAIPLDRRERKAR